MRIIDRLRIFFDIDYKKGLERIKVNQIRNIGFQLMRLRLGKNFLLLHPIIINTGKKKRHSSSMVNLGRL